MEKTRARRLGGRTVAPMSTRNEITLTAPDGTPVKTFRRTAGKKKRDQPRRPRRAIRRVIAGTRHSATGTRDRGESAKSRFHAPQLNIDKVFELCTRRGWEVVDTFALFDFSGTEMDHYYDFVARMELPLDHPDLVDAIVVPDWERFSRNDIETPLLLDRIRRAGGDVVVADQPTLDIYDDAQMPLIALVNAIAARKPREASENGKAIHRARAKAGKVTRSIYGWDKVTRKTGVTLPDGSHATLEPGHLWQNRDEFQYACQILPRLWANESPKRVCKWLNAHGQKMRGVLLYDEEVDAVIQRPRRDWDTQGLMRWVRNVIVKGYVQAGENIGKGKHLAAADPELWDRVNAMYPPRTGGGYDEYEPGPLSGILRCQNCRGTLSIMRDPVSHVPERYQCQTKPCSTPGGIGYANANELVRHRLGVLLHRDSEAVEAVQVSAAESGELDRLRRAASDAATKALHIQQDVALYETNRARYDALCAAAEGDAAAKRDAYEEALRASRIDHLARRATDDLDDLSDPDLRDLIASAWPVIWCRSRKIVGRDGQLVANPPLDDQLWFIGDGKESGFQLPRRGRGHNPAARQPVAWPDGTTVLTVAEYRTLQSEAHMMHAGKVPGASPSDIERWTKARAHFVAFGRTADEILSAVESAGGVKVVAARELGMSAANVAARLKRIREARGESEPTIRERARRERYRRDGVADDDVRDAMELTGGKLSAAARELGMSTSSLRHRLITMSGDQEAIEALRAGCAAASAKARKRRRDGVPSRPRDDGQPPATPPAEQGQTPRGPSVAAAGA
jgi:hypothetical protein